ncbi:hypothetical protein EGX60_24695 [Escherichia coli]|nr:hypothetical protein [Escherichia coli]EFN7689411.1 hypothetical protein [Escherichia coli]EFN7754893.1 hypothetical protein [Escherichia coli]EFN7807581.1 hypothetical protein [Escherichia coli]EFN8552580.1 hypothetical protein [Escherichia coli]
MIGYDLYFSFIKIIILMILFGILRDFSNIIGYKKVVELLSINMRLLTRKEFVGVFFERIKYNRFMPICFITKAKSVLAAIKTNTPTGFS